MYCGVSIKTNIQIAVDTPATFWAYVQHVRLPLVAGVTDAEQLLTVKQTMVSEMAATLSLGQDRITDVTLEAGLGGNASFIIVTILVPIV